MRGNKNWIFVVIMILVFVGIFQQLISNPGSFILPIIIVLIALYFWKFPWRRGGGWSSNNPITRFKEYRIYNQRFTSSKSQPTKRKPRSGHPFKVIDGKKKDPNQKYQ